LLIPQTVVGMELRAQLQLGANQLAQPLVGRHAEDKIYPIELRPENMYRCGYTNSTPSPIPTQYLRQTHWCKTALNVFRP
jgi:hypothetical protein